MDLKIDLTAAVENSKFEAIRVVETNIGGAARQIASKLLNSGNYGPEGLAHEIIRKKIEEYVLSDAFSSKVDTMVEEIVDEQVRSAVVMLLNSKARKYLFQPTSPVDTERDAAYGGKSG